MFCRNCGKQFEGKFCPECGAPMQETVKPKTVKIQPPITRTPEIIEQPKKPKKTWLTIAIVLFAVALLSTMIGVPADAAIGLTSIAGIFTYLIFAIINKIGQKPSMGLFIGMVVCMVLTIGALTSTPSAPATTSEDASKALTAKSSSAPEKAKPKNEIAESHLTGEEPKATMGQKNALAKAKSYLGFSAFSRQGLINQLEFEKFSNDDATYGVDNCGADWNEQATKKAESYLETMSFSRDGLISQLEFEGFTSEQAAYGADAVGY